MKKPRFYLALLSIPLFLLGLVVAPTGASAARVSPDSDAQSVIDWQRIAIRTVYTEGLQPPPIGTLYLGFTALAVNDAVQASLKRGNTDADTAVAVAAHGVLREYFPASAANLDADLAASLSAIADGAQKNKGIRVGQLAASDMIASRVGDGRGDTSIVYTVDTPVPPVGVWAPVPAPPPGGMLAPWLGFVDPLVVSGPVAVDGPDALGSAAYAADYNEVKDVGSAGTTTRTASQTEIALFYATSNPVSQLPLALCNYLEANPIGLERTATLFATSAAAVADTFIQTWRAKYEYGSWRPFEAIRRGEEDDNQATAGDPGWTSLVFPNPPYSEYLSGHGSAVSPFAESVRQELGNDIPLTLAGATTTRSYATLSALEADTLMARIWAGLHFRKAMEDTYYVGHTNAQRVGAALG
ncbi:MAG: vanadium-dependent haloperoxidase [Actinomycetes bacterium]